MAKKKRSATTYRNLKGQFTTKKKYQSVLRSRRYRRAVKPTKPVYKKGFVVLNKKALPSGFEFMARPIRPVQIINRKLGSSFSAQDITARKAYLPKQFQRLSPAEKQKLLIASLKKIEKFKLKRNFASRDIPVQVATLNRNITQSYPVLKRYQSPASLADLKANIEQLDSDLAIVLGELYGLDIADTKTDADLDAKAYEFQGTLKEIVANAGGSEVFDEIIDMATEAGVGKDSAEFTTFQRLYWDEAAIRVQMKNNRVDNIADLVRKRKRDFFDG